MIFGESIAIEISEKQVVMMHLKTSFGGIKIANVRVIPLEYSDVGQEASINIEAHIRDFIKAGRSSADCLYVGIPGERAFIRRIELPLAVKETIGQTLGYELEKYIPLSSEDIYFDYDIVSENTEEKRLNAFLAAIKRAEVARYLELAGRESKNICGIQPTPVAIAGYFGSQLDEDTYGLIHVDEGRIQVIGVMDKHLLFSRAIPVSGENEFRIDSLEGSLKLLRPKNADAGFRAINVYCFGNGLDDAALDELNRSEAFVYHRLDENQLPVEDTRLLGAYSLAWEGLSKSEFGCNLLPKDLRKSSSRFGRFAAMAALIIALISGLVWGGSVMVQKNMALNRLNQQIEEHARQLDDIERIIQKTKTAEARIEFLDGVRSGRMADLMLLRELARVLPMNSWVQDMRIKDKDVVVDGFADSASELIPLLDRSPMFTEVAFLSSINKTREGKERFRIGFKLTGETNL